MDTRTGLAAYGPYCKNGAAGPRELRVGIVGTTEGIEETLGLLHEISAPIEQDPDVDCILHPSFPGLNLEAPFELDLVTKPLWHRPVHFHDLAKLAELCEDPALRCEMLQKCIGLEVRELSRLQSPPDVVLCAVTEPMERLLCSEAARIIKNQTACNTLWSEGKESSSGEARRRFQSALKAESIGSLPTHLLWEAELAASRERCDRATQAWNVSLALLYKAGLSSWQLADAAKGSCHVGISFFRTAEKCTPQAWASFAHVFTETGESFVMTQDATSCASTTGDDGRPHLGREQSENIIARVLGTFKNRFGNLPLKVVIHKATAFTESERVGFKHGLGKIGKYGLVRLTRRGSICHAPRAETGSPRSFHSFRRKIGTCLHVRLCSISAVLPWQKISPTIGSS